MHIGVAVAAVAGRLHIHTLHGYMRALSGKRVRALIDWTDV